MGRRLVWSWSCYGSSVLRLAVVGEDIVEGLTDRRLGARDAFDFRFDGLE